MKRTILRTPVAAPIARGLARAFLWVAGWRLEGAPPPDIPKYIALAAPHTSNHDFVFAMAVCWSNGMNVYWMGKHSLFVHPFRTIMRWLGGIAVDRSRGHQAAKQVIGMFREMDELIMILPPEGTRSYTPCWKSGFLLIARQAKIPIVAGFVDYGRKVGGFGPTFSVEGDKEELMAKLREFYEPITPHRPANRSPVVLAAEKQAAHKKDAE